MWVSLKLIVAKQNIHKIVKYLPRVSRGGPKSSSAEMQCRQGEGSRKIFGVHDQDYNYIQNGKWVVSRNHWELDSSSHGGLVKHSPVLFLVVLYPLYSPQSFLWAQDLFPRYCFHQRLKLRFRHILLHFHSKVDLPFFLFFLCSLNNSSTENVIIADVRPKGPFTYDVAIHFIFGPRHPLLCN